MKITGMFPTITCNNAQELIKFACDNFGFHIEHTPHAIISDKESDSCYVLKNENGVRFDVIQFCVDKPTSGMCINVDDFDEALSIFKKDGYVQKTETVIVDNAKKVLIEKEENIPILLIQHYK